MAPKSSPYLARRQSSPGGGPDIGSSHISVLAVIGFCISGLVLFGVVFWLVVHFLRKRARSKREQARASAFLTVKGVVKEPDFEKEPFPASEVPSLKRAPTNGFSRANLTASIVLPNKTVPRPNASREEIVAYHEAEGNMPRPFRPFSFALNAPFTPLPPPVAISVLDPNGDLMAGSARGSMVSTKGDSDDVRLPPLAISRWSRRGSMLSTIRSSFFGSLGNNSSSPRVSVISTASSGASSTISATGAQVRKVRQIFTPILPDELVLRLGEQVTIMQSFDDGWCIVGRESMFKPGDVELGAVPAWCFVRLMKGLKSERPVRSASLGITVTIETENTKRDDIISWSNF